MPNLGSAIDHLLKAKRISAPSQSYRKDNPAEYAKVEAYLEGGARPTGVVTEMGLGLVEVEDVRRMLAEPPLPPNVARSAPTGVVKVTVTNTVIPVVTGTAQENQTLHTDTGSWTFDEDYLTYAYQWERCDLAGANCVDIAGATNSSYVLTAADVGSTIRSEVTATEHTNVPPSGTLIWNGDLDTGNESQFTGIIRYTAARWQVVTSDGGVTPQQGSYMARVECRQGEPSSWASSLSATLAVRNGLPIGLGKTYPDTYMGWSAWVPSTWPWADNAMHSIFAEIHGNGSMSQANFHWGILGNGGNAGRFFVDLFRAQSGYSPLFQPAFEKLSDPGVANAWHNYTIRVKWSNGGDGKFTFWRDGVQKYDYTGPTAPVTGETIKPQFGIYCRNAPPSSKVMYLDEMKIGTTYSSVQPG